jgi:DNA-binding CsgD family transcriptional regulator/tetratricopeptide (TPR) repeat protein
MSAFVGRESEVAVIEQALDSARSGRLGCVLILGDAGVGKSRLVRESVARNSHAVAVLTARAHALSGTTPFGLWIDCVDSYLSNVVDAHTRDLTAETDQLANTVGRGGQGRSAAGPRPDHSRLVNEVCAFLLKLTATRPVLVVLEDVHDMDPSSWDVLHRLATHVPYTELPITLILTSRSGKLSGHREGMRVLLELDHGGLLQRLPLSPLTRDAVLQLSVNENLSGRVPDRLFERTGGNPFFVNALLSMLRRGDTDAGYFEGGPLPEETVDAARAILAAYGPAERMLLNVLAIAGRVLVSDLSEVTGLTLDELSPSLSVLVNEGLALEHQTNAGWVVEVALPIVRDALLQDLGVAQRLSLHRKVGRVLMTSGRLGEAAQHLAKSATVGDSEAIAVLIEALALADKRGAQRECVKLLGVLGDLLPTGDERWIQVSTALGGWVYDHRAEGDDGTAVAALLKIANLPADAISLADRAAIKARLATVLMYGTGEVELAIRAGSEAHDLLRESGAPASALLMAQLELAYMRAVAGDLDGWMTLASMIVAEHPDIDPVVVEAAHSAIGIAGLIRGSFTAAEGSLLTAIQLAQERGDGIQLVRHWRSLGWCYGYSGRLTDSLDAFRSARASDTDWRDSNLLEIESKIHWLSGNPAAALAAAREGALLGLTLRRSTGAAFGALAALELDDPAEARNFVMRGKSLFGADGTFFVGSEQFRHAEAMLAWYEGDLSEAVRILSRAARRLLEINAPIVAMPLLLDLAELSATEIDSPSELSFAAEAAARIGQADAGAVARGIGELVASFRASRLPGNDEAAEHASAAVSIFERSGYRSLHGRSLVRLAKATKSSSDAVAIMGKAAETFDEAGLKWRRRLALEDLRSFGNSGRRAAAATVGVESLTSREREVAGLAQRRLSAQEIADRLTVSRRTVESHLASIYMKLDVHSRIEFLAVMAEHEGPSMRPQSSS